VRATVAEELPRLANFGDAVEIQGGGEDFVPVAGSLGDDLAARVAEVALAVEFADVPGCFAPDAIDGSNEVAVGDGVGRLLEFPEIFAQTGDRCRGIEDDFRAVEAEGARTFGEMTVVAGVDADFAEAEVEDRIAEVAGAEVELFPEARLKMRDVRLAVLAEVAAFAVDDGRGVVVEALGLDLIHGHDQREAQFFGERLHELDGWAVGDRLGEVVPARGLLGGKVWAVEDFLKADDLCAGSSRLADEADVLLDHSFADFRERLGCRLNIARLDEGAADDSGFLVWHKATSGSS